MDVEKLKNMQTGELEAMRSVLLRQLGRLAPIIDGSVLVAYHGCDNKKGKKTPQMRVQRYTDGKLHSVHVPRDLEETVKEMNAEYQRALSLLHQIGEVSEQIIRNYVPDKRRIRNASRLREHFEILLKDEGIGKV